MSVLLPRHPKYSSHIMNPSHNCWDSAFLLFITLKSIPAWFMASRQASKEYISLQHLRALPSLSFSFLTSITFNANASHVCPVFSFQFPLSVTLLHDSSNKTTSRRLTRSFRSKTGLMMHHVVLPKKSIELYMFSPSCDSKLRTYSALQT